MNLRPVKCHFCKGQMYYNDEPQYEEEVRIDVGNKTDCCFTTETLYAHIRCLGGFLPKEVFAKFSKVLKRKRQPDLRYSYETCGGCGKMRVTGGAKDLKFTLKQLDGFCKCGDKK